MYGATAMLNSLCVLPAAVLAFLVFAVHCEDFATNNWFVTLKQPLEIQQVRELVKRSGFSVINQVLGSNTEYHLVHNGLQSVRSRRSISHTKLLKAESVIDRAEQLTGYVRSKRGYKPLGRLSKSASASSLDRDGDGSDRNNDSDQGAPSDPLYKKEWYLKNTGQADGTVGLDLNVEAAWAQGFTGKGITTAIMDDGIDYLHPDLYNNFNAEASFDFSSNDLYPYPRYTDDWFNSHGTRCAGEIAAARDGKGAVGVAYNSKIAGLRMLDQPYMTDIIEAQSMGYRQDLVDIYSASWGPTDDGKTCDGPRRLTMRSIVAGVNEGRGGKGSIYVWASGDGGPDDDCNCDGYAASMWTISINSVTNDGETANYDESCSSTLASTFSNGKAGYDDAGVATTDLYGNVTTKHSGTSAAAPEAAGVFALALEANLNLSWRDMQHLVVLTSKRNQLHDSSEEHPWKLNGAGLEFNHLFGYGVLDAGAIVGLAVNWTSVPERFHCEANTVTVNRKFDYANPIIVEVNTSGCMNQENHVEYLEHVQAFISTNASRRGNIVMFLTSPMGTRSMILSKRPKDDDSTEGFNKWPFMTTHSWAENPTGKWVLEVRLAADDLSEYGILKDFALVLHGTKTSPYINQSGGEQNMKLQIARRLHSAKERSK